MAIQPHVTVIPAVHAGGLPASMQIAVYNENLASRDRLVPLPFHPSGLVYDGSHLWLSDGGQNRVVKYGRDGVLVGAYSASFSPESLVFDGSYVWVANRQAQSVTKLRASDGMSVGTFDVGAPPTALAFDGISVWAASFQQAVLVRL